MFSNQLVVGIHYVVTSTVIGLEFENVVAWCVKNKYTMIIHYVNQGTLYELVPPLTVMI